MKDGVVIHPRFMVFFDARFPRYTSSVQQTATVTEYLPDTDTTVTTITSTTSTARASDVEARVGGKNLTPCWGCGEFAVTRTEQQ